MEFTDDDAAEAQGAQAAAPNADEVLKEIEKLKAENFKLRAKNRKAEFAVKYGADIADAIPEALPADEWEPLAERIKAMRGPVSTEAPTQPAAAEAPREEPEPDLAAVTTGPSSTENEAVTLTEREWGELLAKNPAEAWSKARYVKFSNGTPNPLVTGKVESDGVIKFDSPLMRQIGPTG